MISDSIGAVDTKVFIIIPSLVVGIIIYYYTKCKKTIHHDKIKYRDLHHYKRNDSNLEIFI